jgi:hypothetical protein
VVTSWGPWAVPKAPMATGLPCPSCGQCCVLAGRSCYQKSPSSLASQRELHRGVLDLREASVTLYHEPGSRVPWAPNRKHALKPLSQWSAPATGVACARGTSAGEHFTCHRDLRCLLCPSHEAMRARHPREQGAGEAEARLPVRTFLKNKEQPSCPHTSLLHSG